ncbi:MAG TPA: 50S ribosomal protein L11 methyltransferase [Hyphomonadaceae bacterium]|jgi:predicted RNA methylase|nr:50S ribosomal protein L11 methyltransferase [Hyphomonadaceae bacterium]
MLAEHQQGGEVLDLAIACYAQGEILKAANLFRAVLQHDPSNAVANHQLGLIAFADGDAVGAEAYFRRAAAAHPWDCEYHNNLGVALHAMGDHAGACVAFENAIAENANSAQTFNNLGASLVALSDAEAAIRAFRRAVEIDPVYIEARDNLDRACLGVAPAWHFPMMADGPRNDAYDQALRRAAPGRRVLDIGSGSGLLAMMAARAGAGSVTTCEVMPAVAAAACEIIAHNGLADRITLHAKRSDQLVVGRDLPVRADLLVTEIFSSGLLTECVLPMIEHAREHLLTPDAAIIPRQAVACGYLVGGGALESQASASHAAGFDLSRFNRFATTKFALHLDRFPHEILSDDFDIFRFDLMQSSFPAERRPFTINARRAGRCIGVAQWLRLELDAETTYENHPSAGAAASGWMHVIYRFPEAVELAAGDEVSLIANHTRTDMTVALAPR